MNHKKIIALFSIAFALFLSASVQYASAQTSCPPGLICTPLPGVTENNQHVPNLGLYLSSDFQFKEIGTSSVAFSTSRLEGELQKDTNVTMCSFANSFAPLGSLERIEKKDIQKTGPWWMTKEGLANAVNNGTAVEFSSFYVYFLAPHAPCYKAATEKKTIDYINSIKTAVLANLKTGRQSPATIRIISANSTLTYNNLREEVVLAAKFVFSVKANDSRNVYIPESSYRPRWMNTKGEFFDTRSQTDLAITPQGYASTTIVSGKKYYVVMGSSTVNFIGESTLPPRELFAGSYAARLSGVGVMIKNYPHDFLDVTIPNSKMTPAVTIIGETSPYISSLTPTEVLTANSIITIKGDRLIGSALYIDGVPSVHTIDSLGTTITFSAANLSKGYHYVELVNPKTGRSNRVDFSVNTISATHSVTPSASVVNSDQAINLRFGVPNGPIAAKLYLSCPAGVTLAAKGDLLCNTWYTFPKVPLNGDGIAFSLNNTTTSDKNVVPNFYLYYPENPNFARGVSSQITVKPAAVAPAKATITVLGPNGGEVLDQSKTYTISWDYTGLEGNDIINIGLRNSNENVCWIGKNSASARSHNFVPSQVKCSGDIVNLNNGGKFKAQVVVDKYANSIGVSDTSNNFFTISSAPTTSTNPTTPTTPPATVKKVSTITLSPLTFTSIPTNNAIPLSWTTDVSGVQGIVILSLYKGGVLYKDVDSVESMGGNGSKSIYIPQTTPAGTYKVRATFINQATNSGPYAETSEFKITATISDASVWTAIKNFFLGR